MTNERFAELFGGPPRTSETEITRARWTWPSPSRRSPRRSCCAWPATPTARSRRAEPVPGGRRGAQLRGQRPPAARGAFENVWIQPAAGDAGGALGAALFAWHQLYGKARTVDGVHDSMQGAYLGPEFRTTRCEAFLRGEGLSRRSCPTPSGRSGGQAHRRGEGGGAGAGPHGVRPARAGRALDHRRPALAQDAVGDEPEDQVPRVLPALRARVLAERPELLRARPRVALHAAGGAGAARSGASAARRRDQLIHPRVHQPGPLDIPAITHVDYSARVQTVRARPIRATTP
jgi:carbamoyltransferase